MSDFDDRIRDSLRLSHTATDAGFVAKVDAQVSVFQRRRSFTLLIVSVFATVLVMGMAASIATLAPLWVELHLQNQFAFPPEAFSLLGAVLPTFSVLALVALVAPLAQAQPRPKK